MQRTRARVPVSAGPKDGPARPGPVVMTRHSPAELLSILLAVLSVTVGLAGPWFAERIGLMQLGARRPVTSTLLTEAVTPVARGGLGRVARAETGATKLEGYEHLRVEYSVTRVDDGMLEIEASLADRASGEVLERFVTWRRQ